MTRCGLSAMVAAEDGLMGRFAVEIELEQIAEPV